MTKTLDELLILERESSGMRYPIELHTGSYYEDDTGVYEWVHRLVRVDKDYQPLYTTGLCLLTYHKEDEQ